jgi:tetratricopeptide (TPR) repeat protein
MLYTYLGIT